MGDTKHKMLAYMLLVLPTQYSFGLYHTSLVDTKMYEKKQSHFEKMNSCRQFMRCSPPLLLKISGTLRAKPISKHVSTFTKVNEYIYVEFYVFFTDF